MFGRTIRVLFGFALASIAAGLTMVLFVTTPVELVNAPAGSTVDLLTANGMLALAAATHCAVFAAPFALLAAAIGEWRGRSHWLYYALAGIVIAGLGFLVQHWSEGGGQTTILNNYALAAFLTTGFVAGMVYWLFSGQFAAADDGPHTPEIINPRAEVKPTPRPVASKP
jgi:hypothetical protein